MTSHVYVNLKRKVSLLCYSPQRIVNNILHHSLGSDAACSWGQRKEAVLFSYLGIPSHQPSNHPRLESHPTLLKTTLPTRALQNNFSHNQ